MSGLSGRLAFLTARSWLDDDGYHVWTSHECVGGRLTTMLPHPLWHADGTQVEPSVACEACGAHYFGELVEPDAAAIYIASQEQFRERLKQRVAEDRLLLERMERYDGGSVDV